MTRGLNGSHVRPVWEGERFRFKVLDRDQEKHTSDKAVGCRKSINACRAKTQGGSHGRLLVRR